LFFPGKTNDAAKLLRDCGLTDFVPGHEEAVEKDGPNGFGLLVNWKSITTGTVTWEAVPGQPYLLGMSADAPCTPDELAREQLFAGYAIELEDGQLWRVPTAAELPTTLRLIDRQWTRVRKPQFDEFWQRSEVWYRRMLVFSFDFAEIMADANLTSQQLDNDWSAYCVFSLRQNYRITEEIASRLGLLDLSTRLQITQATVDGMAIRSVLQELEDRNDEETAGLEKKVPSTVPD